MRKTAFEVNGLDVNSVKTLYLDHGCAIIKDVLDHKMSKLQTD